MSDLAAVGLAVAAWAGAAAGRGPSPWLAGILAVGALASRRPWLVALALFLLAGGLAAAADAGRTPPAFGPFEGSVTLLTDPVPIGDGVGAEARLGRRHVELRAHGASAALLRDRLAGEVLALRGDVEPLAAPAARWARVRHLTARLTVEEVRSYHPGSGAARAANSVRHLVERSSTELRPIERGLYLGMVLGDDRFQAPDVTDDFEAAGLTHLVVVSGQNLAVVLALVAPLLVRWPIGVQWLATLTVIGLFALVTRFEPSVLRASAMGVVAVSGWALGRPAGSLRRLALAVVGVILLDPFLVGATGFRLSVAACAGLAVVAPLVAAFLMDRLGVPTWLAGPVAVSVAAQAAVAPILVAEFGGVPPASLLANLLALPAAGPVTAWGLPAGIAGGVLGPGAAGVLHIPTEVLLAWLLFVAGHIARLPLAELGWPELGALGVAGGLIVVATRAEDAWRHRGAAIGAGALAVGVLGASVLAARPAPGPEVALGPGARLWRAAGSSVVVIDAEARADRVLAGLRTSRVGRLDLLVLTDARAPAQLVAAIERRHPPAALLRPPVARPADVRIGSIAVAVAPRGGRLVVDVRIEPAPGRARAPPPWPARCRG